MSVFNPRHLFRQIPAPSWQSYFESRAVDLPIDLDWTIEESLLADRLIQVYENLDIPRKTAVTAELRRVHALATPRGIDALLNAHEDPIARQWQFRSLSNIPERVLSVFVENARIFEAAEAVLFFDAGKDKRVWKRHDIRVCDPVDRTEEAIQSFASALADKLSPRQGPRRACQIDLCDRHLDGTVQVTLYLETDPNDPVEFVGEGLQRRPTRPATTLALVYHAEAGIVDTVGRGGDKVHVPLIKLFARHLLKREVKPERVKRPVFHLNRLRYGLMFPEDCGLDLVAEGVDCIRMKSTRLKSYQPPMLDLTAVVPGDPRAEATDEACRFHLQERTPFLGPFNLVEATISIHFIPRDGKKPITPAHLEVKQSGQSNLRELGEHSALAERLLRALRVTEPSEVELAIAA